jgi:opacity protein-like surface antigen
MRNVLIPTLAAIVVIWSSAAFAQEPRGYIEGTGGFSTGAGTTTGGTTGEIGMKVAPKIALFGTFGRLQDMQSASLQTSVNDAVTSLAANNDLNATGTARTPASFALGGARILFTNHSAVTPYVFGGVGFARLNPTVHFTYDSGTTLSGNTANTGDDITSDVVANGVFTQPTSTKGLMLRSGGGLQLPFGKHLLGDISYNVSRISATTPINTQGLTFGLGIKF